MKVILFLETKSCFRDNRQRKESNLRKLEEEVGMISLKFNSTSQLFTFVKVPFLTKILEQGRAEGLARKLESNNKGFAMLVRAATKLFSCMNVKLII